jgi:hypothetical protein
MIPIIHINFLLYKTEAGKIEWGISRREGERKKEADYGGERWSVSKNQK